MGCLCLLSHSQVYDITGVDVNIQPYTVYLRSHGMFTGPFWAINDQNTFWHVINRFTSFGIGTCQMF